MDTSINNTGVVANNQPQKRSYIGTKIGAGVGFIASTAGLCANKAILNNMYDQLCMSGYSNGMAKVLTRFRFVATVGLFTGLGALLGKNIQKIAEHIKKDKKSPGGVIPGKNPNPTNVKPEGDPFAKYRVGINNSRTVTTKDKEEYVIIDGHPKKVYKKNPKTGELEYKNAVYDGSWGPEMSDENLIQSIKDTEKMLKKNNK